MDLAAKPSEEMRRDPYRLRLAFRAGLDLASTARLAPGHVQGNLVVLPASFAQDFEAYCRANPKPCPLLGVSAPGQPVMEALGRELDIRTDLARYRVWRDGRLVDEPQDVRGVWRDDLVAFVLGCSYSFEEGLNEAGVRLRHWETGANPPYYVTSIDTRPVGPFAGKLIVSMRALKAPDAITAVEITARYPTVHGAPVHIGFPEQIGVDLSRRAGGDAMLVAPDELPVFWACGVTPENALAGARLPFAITHKPGAMVVTDLLNKSLERR
jgi:uncharacterized protein YcsI (UPF0317 family)